LPSADLSKLQEGGYFWQIDTYLPKEKKWFEDLDISTWLGNQSLLYYSPTIALIKNESMI
jgi:hypothetical protein